MPLSSSRLYCGIEWRNLLRHHFVYQTCLVYINVVLTTYLLEVLYAYGPMGYFIYCYLFMMHVMTLSRSSSDSSWCIGRHITSFAILVATGRLSGRALSKPRYVEN